MDQCVWSSKSQKGQQPSNFLEDYEMGFSEKVIKEVDRGGRNHRISNKPSELKGALTGGDK